MSTLTCTVSPLSEPPSGASLALTSPIDLTVDVPRYHQVVDRICG